MGSAKHQGEKGDGVTEEVDKNKTKDKLKKFGKKETVYSSGSRPEFSSEVHKVRLSLNNCMISVLSLYDSSLSVSSSAIASSNACLASWQALSGEFAIS